MSDVNHKTIDRLRSFTEALEALEGPPLSEFIDTVNEKGAASVEAWLLYQDLNPENRRLADLSLKLRNALNQPGRRKSQ